MYPKNVFRCTSKRWREFIPRNMHNKILPNRMESEGVRKDIIGVVS